MKALLFVIAFGINCYCGIAQQRDKIVYTSKDTSFLLQESDLGKYEGGIIEPFGYLQKGVRSIYDSSLNIRWIQSFNEGTMNGYFFQFHSNNLPKVYGSYVDNNKEGAWLFWNEKGMLVRKELWRKGELMQKQDFDSNQKRIN